MNALSFSFQPTNSAHNILLTFLCNISLFNYAANQCVVAKLQSNWVGQLLVMTTWRWWIRKARSQHANQVSLPQIVQIACRS